VVDDCTCECLALIPDASISGEFGSPRELLTEEFDTAAKRDKIAQETIARREDYKPRNDLPSMNCGEPWILTGRGGRGCAQHHPACDSLPFCRLRFHDARLGKLVMKFAADDNPIFVSLGTRRGVTPPCYVGVGSNVVDRDPSRLVLREHFGL
jgi:hypothetical protein